MSDAVEPLGGAVGENDDCTFDELDGVELGVGLDDNEALANELEIRLFKWVTTNPSCTNQSEALIQVLDMDRPIRGSDAELVQLDMNRPIRCNPNLTDFELLTFDFLFETSGFGFPAETTF